MEGMVPVGEVHGLKSIYHERSRELMWARSRGKELGIRE